jgi:hypothetical protein
MFVFEQNKEELGVTWWQLRHIQETKVKQSRYTPWRRLGGEEV